MLNFDNKKIVIYAEGRFDSTNAKVAASFIRYHAEKCVAVIDSTKAGTTCEQILGFGGSIPVVADLPSILSEEIDVFMIGNGLFHSDLPNEYRSNIKLAIERKMHIVSGIHYRLAQDPELKELAEKMDVVIWDTKEPPAGLGTSQYRLLNISQHIVHTVGSDCRVGKKTTALELANCYNKEQGKAVFAATGQSGIYISGKGIAIDAVPSDFVAGATEKLILDSVADTDSELVIVEGQGSITHPAYSAVTLGLLHGAMPHSLILCHEANLETHKNWERTPLLPLNKLIETYETLGGYLRPCKVVGVSVNCNSLSEEEASAIIAQVERETGLPATDVYKFGAQKLVDAIDRHRHG
jgi:uncharacterized NAD-dependent epimerase/dehydratase family protein